MNRTGARRRAGLAGVVLAAGLLTGCGGDGPEPTGTDTGAASPGAPAPAPVGSDPSPVTGASAGGTTTPGSTTPSTTTPSAPGRVDSTLCDDLRAIVRVRAGAEELALGGPDAQRAANDAVEAAARRVLLLLGPSSGVPEDVVAALRALPQVRIGVVDPESDRSQQVDAVLEQFVRERCG